MSAVYFRALASSEAGGRLSFTLTQESLCRDQPCNVKTHSTEIILGTFALA
jgi:hypothetical protein